MPFGTIPACSLEEELKTDNFLNGKLEEPGSDINNVEIKL